MALLQLVYASRPFGYDEFSLVGILTSARALNERDGITGCLICREDLYLQLLEGPREAVTSAYERIGRDARHIDVALLSTIEADKRLFPNWAMRHDPARSWMWSRAEVAAGSAKQASAADIREIFARVARETA